ncbi:hypothetical protein D9757_005019 [Collybiopsis confluens]|uniref:DUF6699 domain-containing protein n=2 Tax=Collybiopsis confluens TaxID=2823264 RepID=A0A8H5HTM8_9AGAR|nr:hypothetical protein D9757_005019 [Collybiopsis confluens]
MSRIPAPPSSNRTKPPSGAASPTKTRITATLSPGVSSTARIRPKSSVGSNTGPSSSTLKSGSSALSPSPVRTRTKSAVGRTSPSKPPSPSKPSSSRVLKDEAGPSASTMSIKEAIALKRAEAKKAQAAQARQGGGRLDSLEDAVPPPRSRDEGEVLAEDDLLGRWSTLECIERGRSSGVVNISARNLPCIPSVLFEIHLGITPNPLKSVPNEPKLPPSDAPTTGAPKNRRNGDNPSWFEAQDLTTLKAWNNDITEIQHEISLFGSLKVLDLHSNSLSSVPNAVGDLTKLTTLDLSHNKLTELPSKIWTFPELTLINISHNHLTHLSFSAPFSSSASGRKHSSQGSSSFFGPTISRSSVPAPRLTVLNASHNSITSSSIDLDGIPKALVKLDLSFNPLSSNSSRDTSTLVHRLGGLTNLKELKMEGADIGDESFTSDSSGVTSISNPKPSFPRLTLFDLSESRVTPEGIQSALGPPSSASASPSQERQPLLFPPRELSISSAVISSDSSPSAAITLTVLIGKKVVREAWEIEADMRAKKNLRQRAEQFGFGFGEEEEKESTSEGSAAPRRFPEKSTTYSTLGKELKKEAWEIEAEQGLLTEGGRRRARAAAASTPSPVSSRSVLQNGRAADTRPKEVVKEAWEIEAEQASKDSGGGKPKSPLRGMSGLGLANSEYYSRATQTLALPSSAPSAKPGGLGHARAFSSAFSPPSSSSSASISELAVPIPSVPLSEILSIPPIPPDTASFASSLRVLSFKNRRADRSFTLPASASYDVDTGLLPNLEELDLEGCNFSDSVPVARIATGSSGATTPTRSNEPLLSLITTLFPNLVTLNLSYNLLTSDLFKAEEGKPDVLSRILFLPEGGSQAVPKTKGLKHLLLKGNRITNLDAFAAIGRDGLGTGSGGNKFTLEELDVRDNEIVALPPKLGMWPLEVLLVDGNVFGWPNLALSVFKSHDGMMRRSLSIDFKQLQSDLVTISFPCLLQPLAQRSMYPNLADTYARLLLLHGHGYPLWIPEPNAVLPEEYLSSGIRIGDVGFITPDGSFDFLFNVFLPEDHIINQWRGVPEGFTELRWNRSSCAVVPQMQRPGEPICSIGTKSFDLAATASVPIPGLPLNIGGGIELRFTRSRGAVLMLPNGASRMNYQDRALRLHAENNAEHWYQFADALGLEPQNGSLYLITGFDKTCNWEAAAFSHPEQQQSLSLQFAVSGLGNGELRMVRSSAIQSGITSREHLGSEVLNQAVFIRGYKIRLRQSTKARLFGKVKVADITRLTPDSVMYRGDNFIFTPSSSSPQGLGSSSNSSSPTTLSGAREDDMGSDSSRANGSPAFSDISTPISSLSSESEEFDLQIFHPSNIINDYILAKSPTANVAVTHDDEWCSVLKPSDTEFPSDLELINRIDEKFDICVNVTGRSAFLKQRSSLTGPINPPIKQEENEQALLDTLALDHRDYFIMPQATPTLPSDLIYGAQTSVEAPAVEKEAHRNATPHWASSPSLHSDLQESKSFLNPSSSSNNGHRSQQRPRTSSPLATRYTPYSLENRARSSSVSSFKSERSEKRARGSSAFLDMVNLYVGAASNISFGIPDDAPSSLSTDFSYSTLSTPYSNISYSLGYLDKFNPPGSEEAVGGPSDSFRQVASSVIPDDAPSSLSTDSSYSTLNTPYSDVSDSLGSRISSIYLLEGSGGERKAADTSAQIYLQCPGLRCTFTARHNLNRKKFAQKSASISHASRIKEEFPTERPRAVRLGFGPGERVKKDITIPFVPLSILLPHPAFALITDLFESRHPFLLTVHSKIRKLGTRAMQHVISYLCVDPVLTTSLPVCPPKSQFMCSNASEVYARLLLPHGHGYPLWIPEPNANLPPAYLSHGIKIGDIGLVTSDGAFDFLFNIFLSGAHVINRGRVPERFIELARRERSLRETSQMHRPGLPICSSGTDVAMLEAAASVPIPGVPLMIGAGIELNFTQSRGAVLMLPTGASRVDYGDIAGMRKYAAENAESWYQYVNGPSLGREAQNGSLYLITGYDKTSTWENAAFFQSEKTITLKFVASGPGDGRLRLSHSSAMRSGIPNRYILSPGYEGQTLGQGQGCKYNGSVAKQYYASGDVVPSSSFTSSSSVAAGGSSDQTSSSGSSEAHDDNLEISSLESEIPQFSDISSPSSSLSSDSEESSTQIYHPSNIINDYILNKCSTANVAITHDDDWCSILENSDTEVPNGFELIRRIEAKYRLRVDGTGVAFLQAHSSGSVFDSSGADPLEVPLRWEDVPPRIIPTQLRDEKRLSGLTQSRNPPFFTLRRTTISVTILPLSSSPQKIKLYQGGNFTTGGLSQTLFLLPNIKIVSRMIRKRTNMLIPVTQKAREETNERKDEQAHRTRWKPWQPWQKSYQIGSPLYRDKKEDSTCPTNKTEIGGVVIQRAGSSYSKARANDSPFTTPSTPSTGYKSIWNLDGLHTPRKPMLKSVALPGEGVSLNSPRPGSIMDRTQMPVPPGSQRRDPPSPKVPTMNQRQMTRKSYHSNSIKKSSQSSDVFDDSRLTTPLKDILKKPGSLSRLSTPSTPATPTKMHGSANEIKVISSSKAGSEESSTGRNYHHQSLSWSSSAQIDGYLSDSHMLWKLGLSPGEKGISGDESETPSRGYQTFNVSSAPLKPEAIALSWPLTEHTPNSRRHAMNIFFDVAFDPRTSQNVTLPDGGYRMDMPYDTIRLPASSHCTLTEMRLTLDQEEFECWPIVVKRKEGVRCLDVFEAIYHTLHHPLTDEDIRTFGEANIQGSYSFFLQRCDNSPGMPEYNRQYGMQRVDLLRGRRFFRGIVQSGHEWILCLDEYSSSSPY